MTDTDVYKCRLKHLKILKSSLNDFCMLINLGMLHKAVCVAAKMIGGFFFGSQPFQLNFGM